MIRVKNLLFIGGLLFSVVAPVSTVLANETKDLIPGEVTKQTYKSSLDFVEHYYKLEYKYDKGFDKESDFITYLKAKYRYNKDKSVGDLLQSEKDWGILGESGTVYTINKGGIVVKSLEEFAGNDGRYTVYNVTAGAYEPANIKHKSQQLKDTVTLAKFTMGKLTKVDADTGENIAGAEFGLYITNDDGNWERVALIVTNESGTISEASYKYTRNVQTREYSRCEWITNYDKLSDDDKEKYKDVPRTEPELVEVKTAAELKAELTKEKEKVNGIERKWMLVEEYSPQGYVRTNEVWQGKLKNGKVQLPDIALKNTKITNSTSTSRSVEYTGTVELNLTMVDGLTGTGINGGKYSIYISNADTLEDTDEYTLLTKDATFVNGRLRNSYAYQTAEEYTVESGDILYVTNYSAIPWYDRDNYKGLPRSRSSAKDKAADVISAQITANTEAYLAKARNIKIVETVKPDSYAALDEMVFDVEGGKVVDEIKRDGSEKISVSLVDEAGKYVKDGTITVNEAQTGKEVVRITTGTNKTEVPNLRANTGYTVTVEEVPKGYVMPAEPKKTVYSDAEGKTKDTTVTLNRVSYLTDVKGTRLEVVNPDGETVDQWFSDGSEHYISHVVQGVRYEIKEVKVVDGYYKNKNIDFTVKNRDINIEATSNQTFVRGAVNIKGSEFVVYDTSSGKEVDRWTSGVGVFDFSDSEKVRLRQGENINKGGYLLRFTDGLVHAYAIRSDKELVTNIDGIEQGHYLNGLELGREYTIVQEATQPGYVKAADFTFQCVDKDKIYTLDNGQVFINVLDNANNGIIGMGVSVVDEDGNTVFTHITKGKEVAVSNLEAGKSYTIKETDVVTGYTKALDINCNAPVDNSRYDFSLVSNIEQVSLIDTEGNLILNSRLGIYDADGKLVEEWTTGKSIVSLTDKQREELLANGAINIDGDGIRIPYYGEHLREMKGYIRMAVELGLPTLYNSSDEYSIESRFQMAYELLPYSSKELTEKVSSALKRLDKCKEYCTIADAEDLITTLCGEIDEDCKDFDEELDKYYETVEHIELRRTDTGYKAIIVASDRLAEVHEINLDGVEVTHRVSGIVTGAEYTVKEVVPAARYMQASSLAYKSNMGVDKSVAMTGSLKIPAVDTDEEVSYKRWFILALASLTAVVVYILARFGMKNLDVEDVR